MIYKFLVVNAVQSPLHRDLRLTYYRTTSSRTEYKLSATAGGSRLEMLLGKTSIPNLFYRSHE